MTHRFSHAGLGTACFTLLFGSAILLVPLTPAEAAPQERGRSAATAAKISAKTPASKTKFAQAEPETTSSVTKAADDEPACNRPRRRLWVEGEGWVVRRVSVCH
jgi:hypothetical protein